MGTEVVAGKVGRAVEEEGSGEKGKLNGEIVTVGFLWIADETIRTDQSDVYFFALRRLLLSVSGNFFFCLFFPPAVAFLLVSLLAAAASC